MRKAVAMDENPNELGYATLRTFCNIDWSGRVRAVSVGQEHDRAVYQCWSGCRIDVGQDLAIVHSLARGCR